MIYYDALDKDGLAAHQNALIKHNKAFFEVCDGIFLNYQWYDYGTIPRSKAEARDRPFDVYAGVDVWARNCQYQEGSGCQEAVQRATQGGVSVAIFAPGWLQEKGPGRLATPGSAAARDLDCCFWSNVLNPVPGADADPSYQ